MEFLNWISNSEGYVYLNYTVNSGKDRLILKYVVIRSSSYIFYYKLILHNVVCFC